MKHDLSVLPNSAQVARINDLKKRFRSPELIHRIRNVEAATIWGSGGQYYIFDWKNKDIKACHFDGTLAVRHIMDFSQTSPVLMGGISGKLVWALEYYTKTLVLCDLELNCLRRIPVPCDTGYYFQIEGGGVFLGNFQEPHSIYTVGDSGVSLVNGGIGGSCHKNEKLHEIKNGNGLLIRELDKTVLRCTPTRLEQVAELHNVVGLVFDMVLDIDSGNYFVLSIQDSTGFGVVYELSPEYAVIRRIVMHDTLWPNSIWLDDEYLVLSSFKNMSLDIYRLGGL